MFYYSDKSMHDGNWLMNKKKGHGKFMSKDGTIISGTWPNGVKNNTEYQKAAGKEDQRKNPEPKANAPNLVKERMSILQKH